MWENLSSSHEITNFVGDPRGIPTEITFSPTKICRMLVNVAIPEGFHLNYDTWVNNKRQKM